MQNYNDNDVNQLTPITDTPNRVNRQGLVALFGLIALSTPLWYATWYENPVLAALVGLSLLVTPGLSFDMLVYSGMRRPSASIIGSMVILGIAWYSGSISLMMTLGYEFDINRVTIITLVASVLATLIGLIIGGHKTRRLLTKDDLRLAGMFVSTVSIMALVAGGAFFVANNKDVFQPTGSLNLMSLNATENFSQDNPYVAYDNANTIMLNIASEESNNNIEVTFTKETGETFSKLTSVVTTADVTTAKVYLPFVQGCGLVTIKNTTTNQTIDNLHVKAFSYSTCAPVAFVDIFERFDIDMEGAPTDSLKELLKFAEEQLNKANMEDLPQEYKDCIKLEDASLILECIDNV